MRGVGRRRKAPSRPGGGRHIEPLQCDVFAPLGQKAHARGMVDADVLTADILGIRGINGRGSAGMVPEYQPVAGAAARKKMLPALQRDLHQVSRRRLYGRVQPHLLGFGTKIQILRSPGRRAGLCIHLQPQVHGAAEIFSRKNKAAVFHIPGIFFRVDPHRHPLRTDLPYHALRINGTRKVQGKILKPHAAAVRDAAREHLCVKDPPAASAVQCKIAKALQQQPRRLPAARIVVRDVPPVQRQALRVKVIYPRLHAEADAGPFSERGQQRPEARRQGNVVPWQDAPICGVDRFHSHQPSLSLRAAYCQTTRSISTQRPLDSGDLSAFTVMRTVCVPGSSVPVSYRTCCSIISGA